MIKVSCRRCQTNLTSFCKYTETVQCVIEVVWKMLFQEDEKASDSCARWHIQGTFAAC